MASINCTTRGGVCPQQCDDCPDFCETVQLCAELERGSCTLDLGGNSVERNLFAFNIRLQNCSGSLLRVSELSLDLQGHFITVNDADGMDTAITTLQAADDVSDPGTGVLKVIQLTSTCGNVNVPWVSAASEYGGGLTGPSSANLLGSSLSLESGDCCISVILAVDVNATAGQSIVFEPACLSSKGNTVSGSRCCNFERNLLTPGDCLLETLSGRVITPIA